MPTLHQAPPSGHRVTGSQHMLTPPCLRGGTHRIYGRKMDHQEQQQVQLAMLLCRCLGRMPGRTRGLKDLTSPDEVAQLHMHCKVDKRSHRIAQCTSYQWSSLPQEKVMKIGTHTCKKGLHTPIEIYCSSACQSTWLWKPNVQTHTPTSVAATDQGRLAPCVCAILGASTSPKCQGLGMIRAERP